MRPFHSAALAGLLVFGCAPLARPAGYAINDQGARAQGTALAGVATLDGPETIFFAPAGLAELSGWHVAAGLTELHLDVRSTPDLTGVEDRSARDHFELPHVYVARGGIGRWAFGAGLNAPFGLSTKWPRTYPGRFISRAAELRTEQLSLMAAARLRGGWSVGFGPVITRGKIVLVRDVDLSAFRTGHQAEARLKGEGTSCGWRVSTRWRGKSGWSFGATVTGPQDLHVTGGVDYTVPLLGAGSLDQALANLFQDGPAGTTLTLPTTAWAGAGHVGPSWTWEIDATWTDWSVMDRVVIDLAPVVVGSDSLVLNEFFTPRWHDAKSVRGGARHAIKGRWRWAAGAAWDESPVPVETADPLLPDSDRILLAGGVSRGGARLVLDASAQAILFDPLDTRGTGNPFPGRYDSSAMALAVTASWRWGQSLRTRE